MAARTDRSSELAHRKAIGGLAPRRMKQAVDQAQLALLSPRARRRWDGFVWGSEQLADRPDTPAVPPSIGLMVEFLQARGRERAVLHDWVSFGYQETPELCDWLWQAVAPLLEAG